MFKTIVHPIKGYWYVSILKLKQNTTVDLYLRRDFGKVTLEMYEKLALTNITLTFAFQISIAMVTSFTKTFVSVTVCIVDTLPTSAKCCRGKYQDKSVTYTKILIFDIYKRLVFEVNANNSIKHQNLQPILVKSLFIFLFLINAKSKIYPG